VLVLAIETATVHTGVALVSDRGVLASAELGGDRAGHELIVPVLDQLLVWVGAELRHVAGVAVDVGPGLYTGMRVGIATAKTFAQMLPAPIVGLASLDVLAFMHRASARPICAALDAKRGEVFFAFYRPVPGGVTRVSDHAVGSPDLLAAEIIARPEPMLVVGNGGLVYRRALEDAVGDGEFGSPERAFPSATALGDLAVSKFLREEHDPLQGVEPIYLRKTDAEIAWDHRTAGA
jgi:tRNA threonylcarbamoyladenosine biosynthesis protein TsaB